MGAVAAVIIAISITIATKVGLRNIGQKHVPPDRGDTNGASPTLDPSSP